MNSDSIRLALAGAMIGVLALSATVLAKASPPASQAEPTMLYAAEAPVPVRAAQDDRTAETADNGKVYYEGDGGAVPAMAAQDAGPFTVAVRVDEPVWGEKLFVCDEMGSPLAEIIPDADGDAVLGPFAPGRYAVCRGTEEVGAFQLLENAALSSAEGRLWTDGELLHLERFIAGTARLELTLAKPGYYTLELCDPNGRDWFRDLYIADGTRPDREEGYVRMVEFRGLPAGLYTAVRQNTPLGQIEVPAGETVSLRLTIDK